MAEKLILEIELVSSKSDKAFKDVEKQATKSGKKSGANFKKGMDASSIRTSIGGIAKGFIGVTLAVKAFGAAMRTVGETFQNLRVFGRGVAEINSILPKNQKLTEHATQELIEFSKQFGTNQQNQARAFYNIVSAGVKGVDKQLQTLAISNKAAVAGLVDIDTAARVIVSSVNAYAKSGLTATQASDALFVAVREGQTTFGELADSVGNVTSIASNAGVSFNELAGSVAFVTKSGIKTDVAVTGLRQVFASVIKPTKEATDEARKLGIEFNTTGLRSKKLAGFLKDVQERTKGNEQSLSKLFGNIRALAPVLNIVNGNFKEYKRILGETEKAEGSTATAAEILSKTLDFKLNQTQQEFKALALNLLGVLKPAFLEVAETVQFVGKVFNSVFKVDSVKKLDVISKKLTRHARDINHALDNLEFAKKVGNESDISHFKKRVRASRDARKSLLKERADIHAQRKLLGEKDLRNSEANNQKEISDKLATDAFSKTLVQNTSEFVVQQEEMKLTRLQELRDNDLINDQMLAESRIQVRQETQDKLDAIEMQGVENSKLTFDSLARGFELNSKKMKFSAVAVAKIIQTTIGVGVGNAFQDMGAAMREGTSAMDAFGNAMQKMVAQLASQLGDYFIAQGIAQSANPMMPGSGAGMIAGGLGLKVLAGLLGSSGGGSSFGGGENSSSNGGTSDLDRNDGIIDPQEAEFKESRNVQLVVEGSIFNTPETAKSLLNMLNEEFEDSGSTLTGARLA